MPHDSYHGDSYHLALGDRLSHMRRIERIAVCCTRCRRFPVYDWETFRHFRPDMPIQWLYEILPPKCEARDCVRYVVSADLGCSDAG